MKSRELIIQALGGNPVPRIPTGPLAVHFCAGLAGVSITDYTLNPRLLADSVLTYYERFRPDAIWISADTWVTAEAMGAAVAFPRPGQPLCGTGEPLVRTAADLARIPLTDIAGRGRIPLMLEALQLVGEAVGSDVFIVGCFDQSPFSLVCALMGLETALAAAVGSDGLLQDLLEICIEYSAAYGMAMADAGADMLSTGDSPAGLLGPDYYRRTALPAEQEVFRRLRNTEKFLSLHICGNAVQILEDMARSGADVLEIDSLTDAEQACRLVPAHIALWGNLDPVALLERGSAADVERAVADLLAVIERNGKTRFVLSSGCTLTMNTGTEHLKILCSV